MPIVSVDGPVYPSFVPKTDSDGNDIAGVRLVDVTVPLATYTGWALRAGAHRRTTVARQPASPSRSPDHGRPGGHRDPRPSVAERYPTFDAYEHQGEGGADHEMIKDRLLLCEDADDQIDRLVEAGLAAGVPPPNGDLSESELRHCKPPKAKGR